MPSDRTQIRRIAEELEAPHAARILVAEELAADLEALRRELVARGVPRSVARRRAMDILAPSAEALDDLGRLHRPLAARLRDRVARPWGRVELALFAGLSLPVLGSYMVGLGRSGMLLTGGSAHGAVATLTALALGFAVVLGLWGPVRGDASGRHALAGPSVLLAMPTLAVFLALWGAAWDLWWASAAGVAGATEPSSMWLAWLTESAGSLAMALSGALLCGLACLALSVRASRAREAEQALGAGLLPGQPELTLVAPEPETTT
jgi:hypothetical protein